MVDVWLAQQSIQAPVNWAQTGVIGALVLSIIWTGVKRKWIFYWVHEQVVTSMQRQIDAKDVEIVEWKKMALGQTNLVEKTVERAADVVYRTAAAPPPPDGDRDQLLEALLQREIARRQEL